jgi:GNAT superfamily N-acetyltransferase
MVIRKARLEDAGRLRDIETAAGEAFRTLGMHAVAEDPPPSIQELSRYITSGTCWVSTAGEQKAVAYILVDQIDGNVHIAQVTVHPQYARLGIGKALIDEVASWAAPHGFTALTLTTFRDVPWNRPYYERLGFAVVPQRLWPVGIRRLVSAEAADGLAAWPRVVMRRALGEQES